MPDENGSKPNPYDFKECEIGGEIFYRVFLKRDRDTTIAACPDINAAARVMDGLDLSDRVEDEEIMDAGEVVRAMFGRSPHEPASEDSLATEQ